MSPSVQQLYDVCEGTWPPARRWQEGPWTLRDGQGGGKRVSAATASGDFSNADLQQAEAAMRAIGQDPLFQIREGEDELDALLDANGYALIDKVILYSIPTQHLTNIPIPRVTAFTIWEPLAIMAEIWAQGGIGPARLDVMRRAKIKTGILARWNEQPAGVAYAGVFDGIAMVHAVEVLPHQRRQGVAGWLMRKAAFWARDQGASHLSVICVEDNTAANTLYRNLGFEAVGRYHYRQLTDEKSI